MEDKEMNIKSSTPIEHKSKNFNNSENNMPTDVTDNSESDPETQIK